MTVKDIEKIQDKHFVGEEIQVDKLIGTEKTELVKAKIVGIYPYFALVSDGKYNWSVNWSDIC